jgi:hypothetical protein
MQSDELEVNVGERHCNFRILDCYAYMKLTSGTCAWIECGGHNAAKLVITSDESPLSDVQQLTKHSRLAPKILRCGAVLAVQAEFWP